MRRRLVPLLLAVLGVVTVLSAAPADARGTGHAKLVVGSNFPDPGFAHFGKYYYLYSTGQGFPVRRATSPTGPYASRGNSMPKVPGWVGVGPDGRRHLWAPNVFSVRLSSGQTLYVMYFTGYRRGWGSNCVGVATSHYPDRDFAAFGNPICAVHSDHEAIDPTAYRRADGTRWIVFKTNVGNVRDFRIQAVQMDGTYGIRPVAGTRRTLVGPGSSRMEAPSLIAHGGKVWLFLSRGNYADCTYSTDAWRANTFTGPYTRVRTVMSTRSTGLCGPGGATVIQDGSTTRIAFHAWANGTPKSGVRRAWVGVLRWNSAGPYLY